MPVYITMYVTRGELTFCQVTVLALRQLVVNGVNVRRIIIGLCSEVHPGVAVRRGYLFMVD